MTYVDMFRCIPTARLRDFCESYMEAYYPEDRAVQDFCHDAEIDPRFLSRIRREEQPNFSFDVVDRIFTKLECLHLWHLSPEEGGFSDYYYPDIPPAPVEHSTIQRWTLVVEGAKKAARKKGAYWLDHLHERALKEYESQAA